MAEFEEFGRAELEGWSELSTANAYATGFASAAALCVPKIVDLTNAAPGDEVLDVCCGHGVVTEGLVNAGTRATGLDFSNAMVSLATTNVPSATFVQGDATNLPFEDASFDAITMGFGILHIPDSKTAIAEAHRVLKPGGRFVYSVWQGPEHSPAFRIVFGSIQRHGDPNLVLPPGPPIHAFADPDYAFPILEAAGFSGSKLTSVPAYWRVDDPGLPFDYFLEGTVRGALLLRSQPEKNARSIRQNIVDLVRQEFGSDGPWDIPIPAAIVSTTT